MSLIWFDMRSCVQIEFAIRANILNQSNLFLSKFMIKNHSRLIHTDINICMNFFFRNPNKKNHMHRQHGPLKNHVIDFGAVANGSFASSLRSKHIEKNIHFPSQRRTNCEPMENVVLLYRVRSEFATLRYDNGFTLSRYWRFLLLWLRRKNHPFFPSVENGANSQKCVSCVCVLPRFSWLYAKYYVCLFLLFPSLRMRERALVCTGGAFGCLGAHDGPSHQAIQSTTCALPRKFNENITRTHWHRVAWHGMAWYGKCQCKQQQRLTLAKALAHTPSHNGTDNNNKYSISATNNSSSSSSRCQSARWNHFWHWVPLFQWHTWPSFSYIVPSQWCSVASEACKRTDWFRNVFGTLSHCTIQRKNNRANLRTQTNTLPLSIHVWQFYFYSFHLSVLLWWLHVSRFTVSCEGFHWIITPQKSHPHAHISASMWSV